tara:strand:+ start:53 stop:730 length:678 start_codon:yes stop_codon:yes gene_type:complete
MTASIENLLSTIASKDGIALPNIYRVYLPSFSYLGPREMDVLCTSVNLPGRQIMTLDKKIGSIFEKVAYDQAYDDINMSFLMLNDYGARKYFESWQNLALDQDTYTIGYKTDYARNVKIQQLRKGLDINAPNLFQSVASRFADQILDNIDLPINIGAKDVVYECELMDAFPTTMDMIQLGNSQNDQVLQLNVQLSYKNWRSTANEISLTAGRDDIFRQIIGRLLN